MKIQLNYEVNVPSFHLLILHGHLADREQSRPCQANISGVVLQI